MHRFVLPIAVAIITLHAPGFADETKPGGMSIKLLAVQQEQWTGANESEVLAELGEPRKHRRNERTGASRLIYTAPILGGMFAVPAVEALDSREDPSGPGPERLGLELVSINTELSSTVVPEVVGKVKVVFHIDGSGRVSSVDKRVRHKKKSSRTAR